MNSLWDTEMTKRLLQIQTGDSAEDSKWRSGIDLLLELMGCKWVIQRMVISLFLAISWITLLSFLSLCNL